MDFRLDSCCSFRFVRWKCRPSSSSCGLAPPSLRDARAAAAQPQPHLGAEHERVARSGGPRARTPQVCLCAAPSDCRRGCAAAVRAAVRRGPRPAAATAVSHEGSVGACAREAGRVRDAARGEAQARAGAAARRSRGPLQRAGGGAVPAAAQPQGAQRGARRAARVQGGRGAEREAARAAVGRRAGRALRPSCRDGEQLRGAGEGAAPGRHGRRRAPADGGAADRAAGRRGGGGWG